MTSTRTLVNRSLPGPIPKGLEHGDPVIRFIFEEVRACRMRMADLADITGLSLHTLENWSRGRKNPTLYNVRAVLNALGHDLAVVDME